MVAATVEEQLVRPRDVSSFRVYAHGGSPIAMEVVRRAVQAFPGTQLLHLYGATETAPIITGLTNEIDLIDDERGRSAGTPVMGCRVVIRDRDGPPGCYGSTGRGDGSGLQRDGRVLEQAGTDRRRTP